MTESIKSRAFPEKAMLEPLLLWLAENSWIEDKSIVVTELPWNGRRIDLAVLTSSGETCAFELKVRHTRRVLEQASLNGVSFEKSTVVTATKPSASNLAQAAVLGLGVLYIDPSSNVVHLIQEPRSQEVHSQVQRRLTERVTSAKVKQNV